MPLYNVRVRYAMEHFETVKARSLAEAEEKAKEIFCNSADYTDDEFVETEDVEAEKIGPTKNN